MIWFFIALIFFILWLTKKPKNSADHDAAFREGRRSLEDELRRRIYSGDTSPDSLLELLPESDSEPSVSKVSPASVTIRRQAVTDEDYELNDIPVRATRPFAAPKPRNQFGTLNTILYLASFLLVAAAAALIAASMPGSVKLAGLIGVVILFYGAGMILHWKVAVLKPAATAFVGTGLAILPFVGVALHTIGYVPAGASWFIISLVGLVAYYGAAIVLKSQVVSYLTVGFVLSLSCSFIALVPVGFVWYFVALIASSLVAALIARIKPTWLPVAFKEPIERTGQLVTPIALGAALLSYSAMNLTMYQIVFAAATAHYLVLWIQHRSQLFEVLSRVLLHVTLVLYAMSLWGASPTALGIAWLVLLVGQITYSLAVVNKNEHINYSIENIFIGVALVLIPCGIGYWATSPSLPALSVLTWSVFSTAGLATAIRLRASWWGYAPLLGSLVIPTLIGEAVITPALPTEVLALVYLALGAGCLTVIRSRFAASSPATKTLLSIVFGVWLASGVVSALVSGEPLAITATLAVATALILVSSYILKLPTLEIIAGTVFYGTVIALCNYLGIDGEWFALVVALIGCAGLYGLALFHHSRRETTRRGYTVILGVAAGVTALASFTDGATVAAHLSFGLFGAAAIIALLARTRAKATTLVATLITAYATYTVLLWIAGLIIGGWWLVLAYAIGSGILIAASHIERQPWILAGGLLSLTGLAAAFLRAVDTPVDWALLHTVWLAGLLAVALSLYYHSEHDDTRAWISIGAVWILGAIGAASGLSSYDHAYQYGAAVTLLLTGASAVAHGYLVRQRVIAETGLYVATLALQWTLGIAVADVSLVVYAYWWALTIGAAGVAFRNFYKERALIGLSLITVVTAVYGLSSGGGYSLLFLSQNVPLGAVAATPRRQWGVWWGVAGAVAAVIYFLRDYLYVWLALLGLFLIGVVVWRLVVAARERS